MFRLHLWLGLVLCGAVGLLSPRAWAEETSQRQRFAIAVSSGMNGALATPSCREGQAPGRSLGHLAQSVQQARDLAKSEQSQFVSAVHLGDLLGSGSLSRFLLGQPNGAAELSSLIGQSGFNHLVFGHSWYGLPADTLAKVSATWPANGPVALNGNVTCEGRPDCAWLQQQLPYAIVEAGAERVALIGVTSESIANVVDPESLKGLKFEALAKSLTAQATAARSAGATVVFALVHWSGEKRGLASFEAAVRDLAGIDLFVVEDLGIFTDYSAPLQARNQKPVVVVGRTPTSVSLLDFEIERSQESAAVVNVRMRRVAAEQPMASVEAQITKDREIYCQALGQPLPVVATKPIDRETFLTVVLDQIRLATRTEIAITSAGSVASAAFPLNGPVTTADLFDAMRFDNRLRRATVKGAWLRALKAAEKTRKETAASSLLWRGVDEKDGALWVNGRKLDDAMDYWIVVPDYLAAGGDGWIAPGVAFSPIIDTDGTELTVREVTQRSFAAAKPGTSLLELETPHLENNFRWSWSGAASLMADDTRGENKANYEQSALAVTRSSNLTSDFSGRLDGDTLDHALRFTGRITAGYNITPTSTAAKTSGLGEAVYRWRYWWRTSNESPIVPMPYFALRGTLDGARATEDWTTSANAGGELGFRFIPVRPLELKIGAAARRGFLDAPPETVAGLVLGWDLPRFTAKLPITSIDFESSLDYFAAPRAEGVMHDLRGRIRALLPLTSILALTVGYDVVAHGERGAPIGYAGLGTVGITARTTGARQQF